jgi:GntR family transcriptional regulator
MPLYAEIEDAVRDLIEQQRLTPGDRLPGEHDLMARFRVSRLTVVRAVRELEAEGLVVRRQGRGTFVARSKVQVDLQRMKSFTEDMRIRGFRPGGQILEWSVVPAPSDVAQMLRANPSTPLLRIFRLRFANDEPIGLHESFLAEGLTIDRAALERTGSLHAVLNEAHRIRLEEADETIAAVTAASREARLLGVPQGAPLLRVERISYSQMQHPMEVARMVYRGDRYQYFTRLHV